MIGLLINRLLPPAAQLLLEPSKWQEALQQLINVGPIGQATIGLGLALLSLAIVRAGTGVASFVYTYFLRPGPTLQRFGSYAVVTGATDGIGKAYAKALAKKGMNLVLVSRTESKLEAVEEELRGNYNVKVKRCAADLCKVDEPTLARLRETLEGVDVGILINNAGASYDHPDYLETLSNDQVRDLITINTVAPSLLTKLVLPGMKERRRGVVINIGSGIATACPSGPLLTVYAATKAFVEAFSESLDAEVREFGVRVQNQAPMFVATKLAKIRRARLDAPTPDAWARAAVAQIGQDTSISPYWFHGLQVAVIKLAPAWVVVGQVLRMHKAMMRAFYRKQARLQKEAAAAAAAELSDKEPKKAK